MHHRDSGFTIAELMIASSIFAVTILVAVGGFIGIGRLFYKGVTNTQTTEVGRQILNDVAASVSTASYISPRQTSTPATPGYVYYCAGSSRFTFARSSTNLPIQLRKAEASNYDPTSSSANFGLLKDTLPGSSACAAPCVSGSCPTGASPFNSPQELLGDKMWLHDLTISSNASSSGLYTINLVLNYGEGDTLSFDAANPQNDRCVSGSTNQQFCSVVKLNTAVHRGVQQ